MKKFGWHALICGLLLAVSTGSDAQFTAPPNSSKFYYTALVLNPNQSPPSSSQCAGGNNTPASMANMYPLDFNVAHPVP